MRKLILEWMVVGGCSISFLVAALNITFMIQLSASVSHLTGGLSWFSSELVEYGARVSPVLNFGAAILGFLFGTILAGYLVHQPLLDLARPYGRSVTFIGCLLIASYFSLKYSTPLAIFLAGLGCGYQNGLASRFRGMVLRTTHITGLLTDLGVFIGMKVRGHEIDKWKILLPAYLIFSFFLGSVCGAWITLRYQSVSILLIGSAYIVGGLVWSAIKHLGLNQAFSSSN